MIFAPALGWCKPVSQPAYCVVAMLTTPPGGDDAAAESSGGERHMGPQPTTVEKKWLLVSHSKIFVTEFEEAADTVSGGLIVLDLR